MSHQDYDDDSLFIPNDYYYYSTDNASTESPAAPNRSASTPSATPRNENPSKRLVGYTKIKLESMILYDTNIRNWTGLTIKWHKTALDSDSDVIADCKVMKKHKQGLLIHVGNNNDGSPIVRAVNSPTTIMQAMKEVHGITSEDSRQEPWKVMFLQDSSTAEGAFLDVFRWDYHQRLRNKDGHPDQELPNDIYRDVPTIGGAGAEALVVNSAAYTVAHRGGIAEAKTTRTVKNKTTKKGAADSVQH